VDAGGPMQAQQEGAAEGSTTARKKLSDDPSR